MRYLVSAVVLAMAAGCGTTGTYNSSPSTTAGSQGRSGEAATTPPGDQYGGTAGSQGQYGSSSGTQDQYGSGQYGSGAQGPSGDTAGGEAVYTKTCSLCHAAGVAGAPKLGDKTDWGPRIKQGMNTLYDHALKGFQGAKGQMPAKGGNAALSDAEVKSGVDYMVSKAK